MIQQAAWQAWIVKHPFHGSIKLRLHIHQAQHSNNVNNKTHNQMKLKPPTKTHWSTRKCSFPTLKNRHSTRFCNVTISPTHLPSATSPFRPSRSSLRFELSPSSPRRKRKQTKPSESFTKPWNSWYPLHPLLRNERISTKRDQIFRHKTRKPPAIFICKVLRRHSLSQKHSKTTSEKLGGWVISAVESFAREVVVVDNGAREESARPLI